MRSYSCFCGVTIDAEDLDGLIAPARAHMNDVHGLGLTDANTRDYFEAEDRLSPVRPRLDEIGEVQIHPATPDRLDDVLHFFDHEGFAGKPEWAACYCMAHHLGVDGPDYCRATNRASLIQRINDGSTTGFLAYVDGTVAAWCNASPRSTFIHYAGRDEADDSTVGSIACFVVAPPYRRHRLSRRLLDAALDSFVQRGLTTAEAYPHPEPADDNSAYHGALSMYLDAGFEKVGESGPLAVVRKVLV